MPCKQFLFISLFPFDVFILWAVEGGWLTFFSSHSSKNTVCCTCILEIQPSKQKHAHFDEPHRFLQLIWTQFLSSCLFVCFSFFYSIWQTKCEHFKCTVLLITSCSIESNRGLDRDLFWILILCYESIDCIFFHSVLFSTPNLSLHMIHRCVWWWKYPVLNRRLRTTNRAQPVFTMQANFVQLSVVSVHHMSTFSLNELNTLHLSLFSFFTRAKMQTTLQKSAMCGADVKPVRNLWSFLHFPCWSAVCAFCASLGFAMCISTSYPIRCFVMALENLQIRSTVPDPFFINFLMIPFTH